MTVISISGAQGSGKSTVLNAMKADGAFLIDTFKVSRAVQAELGAKSLDDVTNSASAVREFQEIVFDKKYRNDLALSQKPEMYFVERSFIDIAAYTMLWCRNLIINRTFSAADFEWMHRYIARCAEAQKEIYSGSVLIPLLPGIVRETDANRAKYEDADTVYDFCMLFIAQDLGPSFPVCQLYDLDIALRVAKIEAFCKNIKS